MLGHVRMSYIVRLKNQGIRLRMRLTQQLPITLGGGRALLHSGATLSFIGGNPMIEHAVVIQ